MKDEHKKKKKMARIGSNTVIYKGTFVSNQSLLTKKFEFYSQNLKNHGLLYATHSLTNFISKWRLRDRRGQTAPAIEAAEAVATSSEAAAVNNQEPLLSRLAGTGKDKLKRIRFRSN